MSLQAELEENERQLASGIIDKKEYQKRKTSILSAWVGKPTNTDEGTKPPHVGSEPKETSLYEILELESNATEAEIKSKYKKLALKHHPDKNNGIESEKWNKLSEAYKILSDKDKRALYDDYGIVRDSMAGEASFNSHVGGDSWLSYIGNLEIGLWFVSVVEDRNLPGSEVINSAEQKERRHATRVSNIVRYLQDKLNQFPKKDNSESEEFKLFEERLFQEAQKLSVEPNGRKLLSLLGEIYMSKAEIHLNRSLTTTISDGYNRFVDKFSFASGLAFGYFKTKRKLNEKEISEVIWRLTRSEISSITRETCDKILNNKNCSKEESNHLANNLYKLGKVWKEVDQP